MSWGAIGLWVRSTLRRNVRASLFLVLLTGLTAGLVSATFQAVGRSRGTVARFEATNEFNLQGGGCPPGSGLDPNNSDDPEVKSVCASIANTLAAADVLRRMDGVDRVIAITGIAIAVMDPSAPNGWGTGGYIGVTQTSGVTAEGSGFVVAGWVPTDDATDEVLLEETAAQSMHVRVGDVIRLAPWKIGEVAEGFGNTSPTGTPVPTRVVGIFRTSNSLLPRAKDLRGALTSGDLIVGRGWGRAHVDDLNDWGTYFEIALTDHAAGADAFAARLADKPEGWAFSAGNPFTWVHGQFDRAGSVHRAQRHRAIRHHRCDRRAGVRGTHGAAPVPSRNAGPLGPRRPRLHDP